MSVPSLWGKNMWPAATENRGNKQLFIIDALAFVKLMLLLLLPVVLKQRTYFVKRWLAIC